MVLAILTSHGKVYGEICVNYLVTCQLSIKFVVVSEVVYRSLSLVASRFVEDSLSAAYSVGSLFFLLINLLL